jgi:hypothetical protein
MATIVHAANPISPITLLKRSSHKVPDHLCVRLDHLVDRSSSDLNAWLDEAGSLNRMALWKISGDFKASS